VRCPVDICAAANRKMRVTETHSCHCRFRSFLPSLFLSSRPPESRRHFRGEANRIVPDCVLARLLQPQMNTPSYTGTESGNTSERESLSARSPDFLHHRLLPPPLKQQSPHRYHHSHCHREPQTTSVSHLTKSPQSLLSDLSTVSLRSQTRRLSHTRFRFSSVLPPSVPQRDQSRTAVHSELA